MNGSLSSKDRPLRERLSLPFPSKHGILCVVLIVPFAMSTPAWAESSTPKQFPEFHAGSVGNEFLLSLIFEDDLEEDTEINLALEESSEVANNVKVVERKDLASMSQRVFAISFDVATEVEPGNVEELVFVPSSNQLLSYDKENLKFRFRTMRIQPEVPIYRLVSIEPRYSPKHLHGFEHQANSSGYSKSNSYKGKTTTFSAKLTEFPREIIAGEPFEIAGEALQRVQTESGWPWCSSRKKTSPGSKMQLSAGTELMNSFGTFMGGQFKGSTDFTIYCNDGTKLRERRGLEHNAPIDSVTKEERIHFRIRYTLSRPPGDVESALPTEDSATQITEERTPYSFFYSAKITSDANTREIPGPEWLMHYNPDEKERERWKNWTAILMGDLRFVYKPVATAIEIADYEHPEKSNDEPPGKETDKTRPSETGEQDAGAPASAPASTGITGTTTAPRVPASSPDETTSGGTSDVESSSSDDSVKPSGSSEKGESEISGGPRPVDSASLPGGGAEPETQIGVVPQVVGKTIAEAESALRERSLEPHFVAGSVAPSPKQSRTVESVSPSEGTAVGEDMPVEVTIYTDHLVLIEVPSLTGMTFEEVENRLGTKGLLKAAVRTGSRSPSKALAGTVYEQVPVSGSTVAPGSTVTVTIYETWKIKVPNVRGKTTASARSLLQAAELLMEIETGDPASPRVKPGTVYRQRPQMGSEVELGTTVWITVYGEALAVVPNLLAISEAVARKSLSKVGLKMRSRRGSAAPTKRKEGIVYEQVPAARSRIQSGTTVTVTIHDTFVEPPPPRFSLDGRWQTPSSEIIRFVRQPDGSLRAAYSSNNGRLLVVNFDGRFLNLIWAKDNYVDNPRPYCPKDKDGVSYWGEMRLEWKQEPQRLEGTYNYCGDPARFPPAPWHLQKVIP